MNPVTVVFVLQLLSLAIMLEVLTPNGLPTRFVYKLRFDIPIQLGKLFIGKIGLIRNVLGSIAICMIQYISNNVKNSIPNSTITEREIMLAANEAVNQNNGYIYANLAYTVILVAIGIIVYKLYKNYRNGSFNKQPTMVQNSKFDELEDKAKLELFELMYKQGVLSLPLKPKTIDDREYIKGDQIWIPYPKPMTYRTMLKKWQEDH